MSNFLKSIRLLRYIRSFLPENLSQNYKFYSQVRNLIKDTESFSSEQWEEYHFVQLKKIIKFSWDHIVGYRKHWEKGGFHPNQFQILNDIEKIPTITKEIIRNHLDDFTNQKAKSKVMHKTGGSTGMPFHFYEPKEAGIIEKAFIHNLWSRFYPKLSFKTKATIIRGKILPKPIWYDPLHGLYLSTFKLTPQVVKTYIKAIEKHKNPILHAYPSSLYFMGKIIKDNNLKLEHRFKSIMLGSEKLYDFQKDLIKNVFKSPICHWYGQAEKVVLAGNKPENDLFYVYPQYGYLEIISEKGGSITQRGSGEIVGTGYWNYVTPFIRYKTRDRARINNSDKNLSHFSYPIIHEIEGRWQDIVIGKSSNMVSLVSLAHTVASFHGINKFRFVQKEKGKLIFLYTTNRSGPLPDINKIEKKFKQIFKNELTVEINEIDNISLRPSGKNSYLDQYLDIKSFL